MIESSLQGYVTHSQESISNLNSKLKNHYIGMTTMMVHLEALAGIWTRDLCLTKATLYQAELPRHLENMT